MYGYKEVCKADEQLAIKTLLVTDRFFLGHTPVNAGETTGTGTGTGTGACIVGAGAIVTGAGNFNLRKKYVSLSDSVRQHGGQVCLFSSMHVSGQQLDNFTGCAAILRFPLPDIDEDGLREGEGEEEREGKASGYEHSCAHDEKEGVADGNVFLKG